MRTLAGRILLPRPLALDGALVLVALLDVSLADRAAGTVAETRFTAPSGTRRDISFSLAIKDLRGARRLALSAEIHRDGSPDLASGDLRNVRAVAWDPQDSGRAVTIPVEEI